MPSPSNFRLKTSIYIKIALLKLNEFVLYFEYILQSYVLQLLHILILITNFEEICDQVSPITFNAIFEAFSKTIISLFPNLGIYRISNLIMNEGFAYYMGEWSLIIKLLAAYNLVL